MNTQLNPAEETTQLIVYYDGACPLCRKEIGWYKRQRGADAISWRDVSKTSEETVAADLCTTDALQRFHVRKLDGTLASGASAFTELWLQLPRFRLLGVFLKLPFFSQLAELTYKLFLKIRPLIQTRLQRS